MLTPEFLTELKKWQSEGINRVIDIEIGKYGDPEYEKVWCYDHSISSGAFIADIAALHRMDLKSHKREVLERELAALEAEA